MIELIRNAHVQLLCSLALRDEDSLSSPLPDYLFGFTAQQSCEKFLKALISCCGVKYPFTHDLGKLIDLARECGEQVPLPLPVAKQLQPFAVELRYDLGPGMPDASRADIRHAVAALRAAVLQRILALEVEKRFATP